MKPNKAGVNVASGSRVTVTLPPLLLYVSDANHENRLPRVRRRAFRLIEQPFFASAVFLNSTDTAPTARCKILA